MSRVKCDLTISLDGFLAGQNQSLAEPLGEGGERLHRWMFEEPGANAAALEGILGAGAYIMGRNMFAGPGPGAWDAEWRGWWGEEPPYHAPVFVLTHQERAPLEMQGGTTFNFVTDGVEPALAQAREAACSKDVAIAGGARTVQPYLTAGLEAAEVSGTSLVTHVRYRVVR